jgi:hypothetical protein
MEEVVSFFTASRAMHSFTQDLPTRQNHVAFLITQKRRSGKQSWWLIRLEPFRNTRRSGKVFRLSGRLKINSTIKNDRKTK